MSNNPATPSATLRHDLLAAATVFLFFLCYYCFQAAPSIVYRDSGLFALAAESYGIPHPPGSPLYVMLAGTFARLIPAETAFATNLFSGFAGAVALSLLCLLSLRVTRTLLPDAEPLPRLAAAFTSVLLLASFHSMTYLSTTTEQYSLLIALSLLVLLGAWTLLFEAVEDRWRPALLLAFGLAWGLSIANHLSQIHFLVLALLVLGFEVRLKGLAKTLKILPLGFSGLVLGLTPFLWMMLRSRADPVLDWGNVESIERLGWALSRDQWGKRSLWEAPEDFTYYFLLSYFSDRWHFVAFLTLALGVTGAAWLAPRKPLGAVLLAAATLPFAVGIYWGHLTQSGMSNDYLREYGLMDWHLTVYAVLCIPAGAAWLAIAEKRMTLAWTAPALLASWVFAQPFLVSHSNHPERYVDEFLKPLAPDGLLFLSADDMAFSAAYELLRKDGREGPWLGLTVPPVNSRAARAIRENGEWTSKHFQEYWSSVVQDPESNFLNTDLPEAIEDRPLYTEFHMGVAPIASHSLPRGFVVQLMDRPTSDSEVLAADARFYLAESMVIADGERAWGQMARRRGDFFYARSLWEKAHESYAASYACLQNPTTLWRLAECSERLGLTDETGILYRRAIAQGAQEVRVFVLAGLATAREGDFRTAIRYLEEALRKDPENADAKRLLESVRRDLGN